MFFIHLRTVEDALIGVSLGGGLRTAGWTASAATRRRPVIRDEATVSVYRFRVGHRLWNFRSGARRPPDRRCITAAAKKQSKRRRTRSKRNTFNRHCKWRLLPSSTRVSTLLMDQELR